MELDRGPLTSTRKTEPPKKDYCFDLKLGESNVETYPEFSWKELVKEEQQRTLIQRSIDGKPALNPYASDDEDDLKALAAKFEEKYKNDGVTKERRRKRRAEDYIDRGAGYDENDSFIDNSEIYDELVPEDMQPKHGGFYINSGRLEFEEADVSDCDVDEEIEEHRQTKGSTMPKSIPEKKNLPSSDKGGGGGVKKRRVSTTGDQVPGKLSMTKGRKKSESPRGSGSSSPIRPAGKARTITISSQSDSSTSDSSGSSATSTSDTEKDEEAPPPPTPVLKPKPQPTGLPVSAQPLPTTSGSQSQPAPRRLKVKNVPLNPKLHGGQVLPQAELAGKSVAAPGLIPPKKSINQMSNREIFGSQLKPSLSGLNIPTGLSATSILPATVVPPSSTPPPPPPPLKMGLPSTSPNNSGGVVKSKPKVRRRVTDRQVPGNMTKKPASTLMATSPSSISPARKRQKLDPLVGSPRQGLGLGGVANNKKPRKPRVSSSLLRNPTTTATASASTNQRAPIMSAQQLQALRQFHLHPSHALQYLPMQILGDHDDLLAAYQNLSALTKLGSIPGPLQPQSKVKPPSSADILKNLASFQSQVGTGVTVSEVKKTKPRALSPSTSSLAATISPRSNTPPSRLSNSSPINIPRIIPSSITVTSSNVRNTQQQQQRSAPGGNSATFSAAPPPISPNFQSAVPNKTFTAFGVSTLLSKHFNNNGNSSGK